MFDDIKQNNQSGQTRDTQDFSLPSQSQPSVAMPTSAPVNPRKGIDDMFGDVDPIAQASQPIIPAVNRPSAVQSGKLRPIATVSTPAAPISSGVIPPTDVNQLLVEEESGGQSILKKILIALVGIILLGVVVTAVYYFFVLKNNNTTETPPVNTPPPTETPPVNTPPPTETPPVNQDNLDNDADGLTNLEEERLQTDPDDPDTDNDGLFDREETKTYRTDPNSSDTDNDGLFDREEVVIWKTDPLDADSDNDTYLDGVEVANGYDPLGEGKLPTNEVN